MVAADYKLKDRLGPAVPVHIGGWISGVDPAFRADLFIADATAGLDDLELLARARHVAHAMHDHLPSDQARALSILTESLPTQRPDGEWKGHPGFALFAYVEYVSAYGLPAFDEAMTLQYQLTKLLTAELSIRTFIDNDYERTMRQLEVWVTDDSEHVRRLVSEGTRPRLPWSPRLRRFQADTSPILPLLDQLKDDPSEYVRRSVANNLNDIGKDHPDVLLEVASDWYQPDSRPNRKRLVRHALRSLVKAGNLEALAVLGYFPSSELIVDQLDLVPESPRIGQRLVINGSVRNSGDRETGVLVDISVAFRKANTRSSTKVFKGAQFTLDPGESRTVTKSISLAQHSTRKHHPGLHRVGLLVNGVECDSAEFELLPT
ncbi:MAG: DNA alkylation repair protein [Actinobacteria bacterium]|nr:DNA alkylation repair protein [Actinomycetota bacterium]